MTLHVRTNCLTALLAAIVLLIAQPAAAATVTMRSYGTAVSSCQAALPAFEGQIRKRPLSVQNEGTMPAFLSCSLPAGDLVRRASVFVTSFDGQPHSVTCTGVVGYLNGNPHYVTKTVLAGANGAQVEAALVPTDVGRMNDLGTTYVSFSCSMPPGTGMATTQVSWEQQVGA